ncbi:hypothetical protein B9Z55_013903 [Caenorhabditis nigoni]|uniref:Uncharacterized protein n=1 Tax=Caenorhabditis nigoni TaxID=1611254 RepID=A0A2G5U3Q4_9PELO|nr:hypothetical protein B9Z55_013903 [Caenorhabditis nigoni]
MEAILEKNNNKLFVVKKKERGLEIKFISNMETMGFRVLFPQNVDSGKDGFAETNMGKYSRNREKKWETLHISHQYKLTISKKEYLEVNA